MLPRPSSSKARPWVAAALLLCLALLSPVQAQQCYRADQQANVSRGARTPREAFRCLKPALALGGRRRAGA